MDDKEKGMVALFSLGDALEDFGLHVVREFGVWHVKGSNGDVISKGDKLFYQIMNYFGVKTTKGPLDTSPSKQSVIILARTVDLFYR